MREPEGRIEIEPAPTPMRLAKGRHGLSAMPGVELPPLTDEIDQLDVPFPDRETLLRDKRASGRLQDLADAAALERRQEG